MITRCVRLVDRSRAVLAVAHGVAEGSYFGGTVDLRSKPTHSRALFGEFEEVVNGQMFAFLDETRERIGSLSLLAAFDDGLDADIEDLQVFPGTGDVSFRLIDEPTRAARPA